VSPCGCLVCAKHRAADATIEVFRTDLAYVGHHPAGPDAYRGHLFVEPLRHAAGLADLTDEEAASVGTAATRAARALAAVGAEHVYSVVYGDRVPHLHVHLLPRWPGTPREYWGLNIADWPDAPRADATSIGAIVDSVRAAARV